MFAQIAVGMKIVTAEVLSAILLFVQSSDPSSLPGWALPGSAVAIVAACIAYVVKQFASGNIVQQDAKRQIEESHRREERLLQTIEANTRAFQEFSELVAHLIADATSREDTWRRIAESRMTPNEKPARAL